MKYGAGYRKVDVWVENLWPGNGIWAIEQSRTDLRAQVYRQGNGGNRVKYLDVYVGDSIALFGRPEPIAIGPRQRRYVRLAQEAIAANATEDLPLATIAALAGTSPFHLARLFRRVTGSSMHRYQTALRLRVALRELGGVFGVAVLAAIFAGAVHCYWVPISAGIIRGRRATSVAAIKADLGAFLPETILSVFVCVLLLHDLFGKNPAPKRAGLLALAATVPAGIALALQTVNPGREIVSGMMRVDPFGQFFKGLIIVGTGISVVMAMSFESFSKRRMGEFYALLLGAALGMFVMSAATNLLIFYLGVEFSSMASYLLTAFVKRDLKGSEAGMKYAIYGSVASGVMIFGLSLVYGLTGSLHVSDLAQTFLKFGDVLEPSTLRVGEEAWVERARRAQEPRADEVDEVEQFAQALGLRAADGNLRLLAVVHAEGDARPAPVHELHAEVPGAVAAPVVEILGADSDVTQGLRTHGNVFHDVRERRRVPPAPAAPRAARGRPASRGR